MRNNRHALVLISLAAGLLGLTGCLSLPEGTDGAGTAGVSSQPQDETCPTDVPRSPEEEIPQNVVDELAGLTEDAAATCAEQLGWGFRIVRRDDSEFQVTMDYRPDRVNVTIDAGVVTSARVG